MQELKIKAVSCLGEGIEKSSIKVDDEEREVQEKRMENFLWMYFKLL